ncbi:MAG: hypothetical protein MI924_06940, partial [Chloroflexales bacterium]|nr:hypothetical protein [Chloroflexales bacterium]
GWYPANPLTVTLTVRNTAAHLQVYSPRVFISSPDDAARFHLFANSPACLPLVDGTSYRSFDDTCTIDMLPNTTQTLHWNIWVQPSITATLTVSAELRLDDMGPVISTTGPETVSIHQAAIHPVVFLHGILGSMPPQDKLLETNDDVRAVLDPFLGSYWPLIDQLQKMGYELNRTLFPLAYDWRQPNDVSAQFLADQLTTIKARAEAVAYVARTPGTNPPDPDNVDIDVDLVVHSMGGLVARSYVQGSNYQDDVRKAIFIASPHKGFAFDYQTWEGMTWRDYLYNASWQTGNFGGLLQGLMDTQIWPILVKKKYAPTDAELARDCDRVILLPIIDGGEYIFSDSSGLKWNCTMDDIGMWAHAIDTTSSAAGLNRGVRSLYEMLPTDDLALPAGLAPASAYLLADDAVSASPFGYQKNDYLHELNRNIGTLTSRLGIDNIYAIYGDNAPTDARYQVAKTGALDRNEPNLWRYGAVRRDSQITERDAGDDLILANSASLRESGLLASLSPDNDIGIDDVASQRDNLGPARHKEIVYQLQTQSEFVPQFLGVISPTLALPFTTGYTVPPWRALGNIGRLVSITSDCPINLLITDPQGRRLGYDPASGQVLNEIPNALYTLPHVEPQIIVIADPLEGAYQVTAAGYDAGAYGIQVVDVAEDTGVTHLDFFAGMTATGQVDTFAYTYTAPSSMAFPATGMLDDFNRPDAEFSGIWGGDLKEYHIYDNALSPSGGNGAIYWDNRFAAEQEVYVTLATVDSAAREINLLLKGQGASQCDVLLVSYDPAAQRVQVWTCHNFGQWTQHGGDLAVTFQDGDQFGARARADRTIAVYRNGELIGTVSIADTWPYRANDGRIGLWTIGGSGTVFDTFGGGTLP